MFQLTNLKGKNIKGMFYQSDLLPFSKFTSEKNIPFSKSRGQRVNKKGKEEILLESNKNVNEYKDIQNLLVKK